MWRSPVLGLALWLASTIPASATALRSLPAQPPPPPPQTRATISRLVADTWQVTKAVRLGEEVRFALRIRKTEPGQTIEGATLSVRRTRLDQDGAYHYGTDLSNVPMHRFALPNGDIRFVRIMRLRDPRLVGKASVEFHVHAGQGEFVPHLLLTVKPVTGNITGGDPYIAAHWGLRMTVSLPRLSYPRDALILATIRVRNVWHSSRTIQSGYCSKPPWIETLGTGGWTTSIPFGTRGPICSGMISTTIGPGRSTTRHQYVELSSVRLRAATTIGNIHVHGSPLLLHLTGGSIPAVSVKDTGAAITIRLRPHQSISGPLHYDFQVDCARSGQMIPVLGSHGWRSLSGTRLAAVRPAGCDPAAPWAYHALAGWIGQPLAHIDVVSTKPLPCNRGIIARRPELPGISLATLNEIGISLLPPASHATVCRADATYQVQLPFSGSAQPPAVLAQVASHTDPVVNGHLAWVIRTSSSDPNHPHNPPVLYLSLVDAHSGALLNIVYAGGLHPPGRPIHLQLPVTGREWIILSGTIEKPRVGETQARQAMATAPGGRGATVRAVVLARVYNPNTPTLRDHMCWIFSVIPPHRGAIVPHDAYWLINVDAETGKVLMAGGTESLGGSPLVFRSGSS